MDRGAGTRLRTDAQCRGDAAEARAFAHLVAHGLVPVARNVRFKVGELDLVMRDGATLVFVEVRRRRHAGWGDALASIDHGKARRIARAAEAFLQRHAAWSSSPCRFDVVAFDADDPQPRWHRHAFALDDLGWR